MLLFPISLSHIQNESYSRNNNAYNVRHLSCMVYCKIMFHLNEIFLKNTSMQNFDQQFIVM